MKHDGTIEYRPAKICAITTIPVNRNSTSSNTINNNVLLPSVLYDSLEIAARSGEELHHAVNCFVAMEKRKATEVNNKG